MKKHGRLFCALLLSILLIGALAVGCGEIALESPLNSESSTKIENSTSEKPDSDSVGNDDGDSNSANSSEEGKDDSVNGGTWTGEVPLS